MGARTALQWLGAYFGVWTMVALYMICEELLLARNGLQVDSLLTIIGMALVQHYGWALVSLLTLALVRAVPLHRDATPRTWIIHLLASVGITMIGLGVMAAIVPLFYTPRFAYLPRLWAITRQGFHYCFLIYYWGVLGCYEGIQLYRHLKERQRTALLLHSKLAQAQLQALEMHLSPHFLFNTLNTVAALMHSDPPAADRILLKLSGLLRSNLNRANEQQATLHEELAFLEGYLDIERIRFGRRLSMDIQVPAALQEALVPTFMLQPLVENAIKHGVAPRASGGSITLRARTEGPSLLLEVEREGPYSPTDGLDGTASFNARIRLEHLYGDAQRFENATRTGGGVLTRIRIPYSSTEATWNRSGGLP
jgi:hypothetical protein